MTSRHQPSSEEAREWAALYAVGALPPEEKAYFEAHLREGCAACEVELRSLQDVAGQLGFTSPLVRAPAELRQRLLDRIRATQAQTLPPGVLFQKAGLLIYRAEDRPWQEGGLPGLWSRPLFVDSERAYTTALVRMEPGMAYPSHRHSDVEELYMLEGDLVVEGQAMRPGDYCRAEPGTIHGEVRTDTGALFLVMFSQRDELLV